MSRNDPARPVHVHNFVPTRAISDDGAAISTSRCACGAPGPLIVTPRAPRTPVDRPPLPPAPPVAPALAEAVRQLVEVHGLAELRRAVGEVGTITTQGGPKR